MQPVVMDLGSAGPFQQVRSRRDALNLEEDAARKCSAPYRCPELTQVANEVDIAGWCDIWALGCTMYCLAFGRSPFETAREGVLKLAILNAKYTVPAGNRNRDVVFSQDFVDLIGAMLRLDYETRPSAVDVKDRVKELLEMQGGY
jgi:serine/threonine kinase 16